MIDADQFDDWCLWDRWYPIDDQSNHHYPVAHLHASMLNLMKEKSQTPFNFRNCLLFGGPEAEQDIEAILLKGDW